jgi:hypothetical protein
MENTHQCQPGALTLAAVDMNDILKKEKQKQMMQKNQKQMMNEKGAKQNRRHEGKAQNNEAQK